LAVRRFRVPADLFVDRFAVDFFAVRFAVDFAFVVLTSAPVEPGRRPRLGALDAASSSSICWEQ